MGSLNHFISMDPGGSNGWATFSTESKLTALGVVKGGLKGLVDFLHGRDSLAYLDQSVPKVCIVETYRIKNYQHTHDMSTVPTIRILGAIEAWCYLNDIRMVEQESTAYKTGLRWAGHAIPKGHTPDQMAALGHGVYYLHKQGLWEIKL